LFEINDLKSKIVLYEKTKLSLETQLIELIDVKTQLSLAKKDIFTLQHKSGNDSNQIDSLKKLITEKDNNIGFLEKQSDAEKKEIVFLKQDLLEKEESLSSSSNLLAKANAALKNQLNLVQIHKLV
jgi:hypothetical protein